MIDDDLEADALERLGPLRFAVVSAIDERAGRFDSVPEGALAGLLPDRVRRDADATLDWFNDLARKAPEVLRYRRTDGTLMWKVRAQWETYSASVIVRGT